MKKEEEKRWQAYQQLCRDIELSSSSGIDFQESATAKQSRIKRLLKDYEAFCHYYFPKYSKAKHGWFHKRAAKMLADNPAGFFAFEFPRGHAKSTIIGTFYPIYRLCLSISTGKPTFTGLIKASDSRDKAEVLLSNIQAELEFNARLKTDFGDLKGMGSWTDGHFIDRQGNGYWAIGAMQNPRGSHVGERRPSIIVIDDIDNAEIVKNEVRCKQRADWCQEDLGGCFDIGDTFGQMILINNRIGRKSTVAHLVGNIDEATPVKAGIHNLVVYAIENPKTHAKSDFGVPGAQPAWKEYLTFDHLKTQQERIGSIAFRREYFHEPFVTGNIFQNDWFQFVKPLKPAEYDDVITYCDPSFKDTKKNDYKAIILVGRKGSTFHILDCFVRQTTKSEMVRAHYEYWIYWRNTRCRHFIEANFTQDSLLEDYNSMAIEYGAPMPIRPDLRAKYDKAARIESLTPLFERKQILFAEKLKDDRDGRNLIDQFINFPSGHDDGPDAVEGAIFLMGTEARSADTRMMQGKYKHNSSRGSR